MVIKDVFSAKVETSYYPTCATINHSYYYFFLKSHVGFSLMIGAIPLKNVWLQNKSGYQSSTVNTVLYMKLKTLQKIVTV